MSLLLSPLYIRYYQTSAGAKILVFKSVTLSASFGRKRIKCGVFQVFCSLSLVRVCLRDISKTNSAKMNADP